MMALMDEDVIHVTTEMDQEEIAQIFTRYDLVSAPVIDDDDQVVGQITVDDVMDVIVDEGTEDIYKLAGTSEEEIEKTSVLGVAWTRLPWQCSACWGASCLVSSSTSSMSRGKRRSRLRPSYL